MISIEELKRKLRSKKKQVSDTLPTMHLKEPAVEDRSALIKIIWWGYYELLGCKLPKGYSKKKWKLSEVKHMKKSESAREGAYWGYYIIIERK